MWRIYIFTLNISDVNIFQKFLVYLWKFGQKYMLVRIFLNQWTRMNLKTLNILIFFQLWDQQMIHFVILSGVACVLIVAELSRYYLYWSFSSLCSSWIIRGPKNIFFWLAPSVKSVSYVYDSSAKEKNGVKKWWKKCH